MMTGWRTGWLKGLAAALARVFSEHTRVLLVPHRDAHGPILFLAPTTATAVLSGTRAGRAVEMRRQRSTSSPAGQ
eukprot:364716-Chlamydomonas_euryale.AAC.2